jgi:cell shape-determining protein MreD
MSMAGERRVDTLERIPLARLLLLSLTITVFHVAFLSRMVLFNVRPETLLLLSIVGAVWMGARSGAVLGFIAGLFNDILGHGALGLWPLILGLMGFMIGYSHDQAFSMTRERVPFGLVAGGTIFGTFAFMGLSSIVTDAPSPDPKRIGFIVLFSVLWSLLLTIPMRFIVHFSVPLGSRR